MEKLTKLRAKDPKKYGKSYSWKSIKLTNEVDLIDVDEEQTKYLDLFTGYAISR
jgi:hypothetical protein